MPGDLSDAILLILTGQGEPFVIPNPPWLTVRDRDILADIRARLVAINLFSVVESGVITEDNHTQANARPLVLVAPASSTEQDESLELAIVTLKVAIAVIDEDQEPGGRHDKLDRWANLVANAVNRENLAGITVPGLTRVKGRRYQATTAPDQAIILDLDAVYFVDQPAGRDSTV